MRCALLTSLLIMIALLFAGCASTASPDVGVDKDQQMLTGDDITVNVPESVTIKYEGDVPDTVHGDFTLGVWTQRHNADSETGIESQLENMQRLQDLVDAEADVQTNAGGGAGSQE